MIQLLRRYSQYTNSWVNIRYEPSGWRTSAYYKGLLPYDGVYFDREFFFIWEEL